MALPVDDPALSALCDRSLDPLFWRAERVGTLSAWWAHVPFAQWLVSSIRPGLLVELGTYTGVSYCAFCSAVLRQHLDTSCFAVDTWQGDEHSGTYGDEIYWPFRAYHDERFSAFSHLLRTTFDEALSQFENGSIDLLHIDGLHTYTAVKHDFEFWLPKVSARGVVLFHDINERERDFGVWRLWSELKQRYPSFEFLHGHGLGLLAVGPEIPDAVRALCAIGDPSSLATLRERFAFLGERWVSEMRERASVERERASVERERASVERERASAESEARERAKIEADLRAAVRTEAEARTAADKRAAALELAEAQARSAARTEAEARTRAEQEAAQARSDAGIARSQAGSAQRIAELEQAWRQSLESSYRETKAALDGLQAEAKRLRAERDSVVQSRVWRMAKPLRRAGRMLRGEPAASSSAAEDITPEIRRQIEVVSVSPLFNARWYLEQYPDVATAGFDPAVHYVLHGAAEKRNPGPAFDGNAYLERYPDVAAQTFNPLVHYEQFGAAEHREIQPVRLPGSESPEEQELLRKIELLRRSPLFDAQWYYEQNIDVATAKLDPVEHYVRFGASEKRNPGPQFDGNWYLERYPDVAAQQMNPLVHYIEHGAEEHRETRPVAPCAGRDSQTAGPVGPTLDQMVQAHFPALIPLRTFPVPDAPPRVTIITDSINAGFLYGGVGTALMLSALIARNLGATLRLVTRSQTPEASNFGSVLALNGIPWESEIEFVHSPPVGGREVPISQNDLFITTSWWTTTIMKKVVDPSRIVYLLQEDERMFYPFGDERLRCEEALSSTGIRFVINSELLFRHLTTGPEALPNISDSGAWFEPAFPSTHYYPERTTVPPGTKRNFFFYARPQNLRNLYWRGVEAIGAAIEDGVLRPDEWNFHFVGRSLDTFVLPRDIQPIVVQNLPWSEYAALLRSMDLGLCLMDTPHPSYPPLDLAACGAVVVTNTRGLKTSLSQYSENILCADPGVEDLTAALRQGVALAADEATRFANFARNGMLRDWNLALGPVAETLAAALRKQGA